MTNPRIHRFDFSGLRDFRGPIVVNTAQQLEVAEVPVVPPPPVFSEQDLQAAQMLAKGQGYNEGFAAGKLEAQKEADQTTATANEAILKLGDTISALGANYAQMLKYESQHLSQLITSVARKVAGESMNERGEAAILAIVERCLPVLFAKPKLVIDLNPEIFERTLERIEELFRANGIEAEIQFRANPEMGVSDINLDWGTGQISRDAEKLWEEITTLIERVPLEITFNETLTTNENQ